MIRELKDVERYLLSDSNEDAKRKFIYPLFKKLFGKNFLTESDANGADGYVEGKLLIELKSKHEDWISGFYQGLHYLKKGNSFPTICVISHKFIGLWKISNIPEKVKSIVDNSDPLKSANEIGKINSHKSNQLYRKQILKSSLFLLMNTDFSRFFIRDLEIQLSSFLNILKNLDSARLQINERNFIDCIELMKKFFDDPLQTIHCFYAIIGSWDPTSKVAINNTTRELRVIGMKGRSFSEGIYVKSDFVDDFIGFVENRYIFTNEGSGLTVDYYFSRFDEVLSRIKPEYAREHGIFFTNHNLSKFALWFVRHYYEKKLSDKYLVFDPAGGSGNLVTSWYGHLKHKIVSELEPELLKTIERRMKLDDYHVGNFTVIPKTIENKGLNFLDISAEEYIDEIEKVLTEKNLQLDKPIAFLLNPPYRNTDKGSA